MNQENKEQQSQQKQNHIEKDSSDGQPRFGLLLLVLLAAVVIVVMLTFASEAYYS